MAELQGLESATQLDNTIRAVREKRPVPEIDFTLHTMEDGSQVNTLERVCKGERFAFIDTHVEFCVSGSYSISFFPSS
jgi:hypothetical protein